MKLRAKLDTDPKLSADAKRTIIEIELGFDFVRYDKIRDFSLWVLLVLTFPVWVPLLLLWLPVRWLLNRTRVNRELTVFYGHIPHLQWRYSIAMDRSFWRYVGNRLSQIEVTLTPSNRP